MQYPSLTAQKDLPSDINLWDPSPSPKMRSVFDEMLHVYSHKPHHVTDDPTSSTTGFRQIMLSMWIGFLDRTKYVLNSTHKQLYRGDKGDKVPSTTLYGWQEWLFMDLVMLKDDLEFILIHLYRNMKALQVTATESGRPGFITPWEADEWRFCETRLLSLRRTVKSTAETHMHSVSGEAIRSSNAQSLSVARLTTLATVFVPISLIAGIFSIGGDYAVGESKFWVFFAVTVPIGMVISLFLFTKFAALLKGFIGKVLVLRDRVRGGKSRHRGKIASILPLFNKKVP